MARFIFAMIIRIIITFGVIALIVFLLWGFLYLLLYWYANAF